MKRHPVRSTAVAALLICSFALTACGGGGGGSSMPPVQQPTPIPPTSAPAPQPGTQSSDACPSSGAAPSLAGIGTRSVAMRPVTAHGFGERYVPGTIVYTDTSGSTHVETVASARVDAELSRLRSAQGIRTAQRAQYRHALSVTPSDPYYRGFGPGAPYYESSSVPGQWDMHIIGLGTAWSSVEKGAPIAIIDTGADLKHPDLSGSKVVYAHCYVTYPASAPQSSSSYVTDMDGHGTNVAGIADADTNNNFGFAGTAFDAPLLIFRIFPTPPSGGCTSSSSSAQCDTTDVDEVSAINDAVAHGARVINLSLGADGPLANCKDTIEENAIENAIAHGVVVVAAAGNESANHLDCPAAYPGVIAVGASALEGSSTLSEGVASYSNWSDSSGPGSGGAYLVAPGGDPTGNTDANDLHWIENIYSSTAVSPGACGVDQAGGQSDCRILIAGTSQATPHVAGVASLMLGRNPRLTPAQVAADLCAAATNIGSSKQGCGRLDAAGAVARAGQ